MTATAKHTEKGRFEYIYVEGFVMYASLQKPKKGYEGKGMEYSMNMFITQEDVDILDAVPLNKVFFSVGIDKNKKKVVKFPFDTHEEYRGLFGFGLHRPAKSKSGESAFVTVIDLDRKPVKCAIGNGSRVKVKCYGWRNEDKLLSVAIDTVQILDLVEYTENNEVSDDEFGGAYEKRGLPEKADNTQSHDADDEDEGLDPDSQKEADDGLATSPALSDKDADPEGKY